MYSYESAESNESLFSLLNIEIALYALYDQESHIGTEKPIPLVIISSESQTQSNFNTVI